MISGWPTVTKVCTKIHEKLSTVSKVEIGKKGHIGYTGKQKHVHNSDSLFTLPFWRKDIRPSWTQQTQTFKKHGMCRLTNIIYYTIIVPTKCTSFY
jgi:hypothetical protein